MGEKSEVIISLFGILDVTGEVVAMWLILLIACILSLVVKLTFRERPGKLQNIIEAGVEYLVNFFSDVLGREKTRKYFVFLASLFVFIIISNYSGLIPGVGHTPYVKAPTSSLSVTAGLSLTCFVFLQVAGLRHNVKHYFKRFVVPMFFMLPLTVLDEIIKPLSLSLRLFGNIFGEEMVTEQLYHIFPIGLPVVMMALSILFCALQAVVYTTLISIYLGEVTEEIEEAEPKKLKKRNKNLLSK